MPASTSGDATTGRSRNDVARGPREGGQLSETAGSGDIARGPPGERPGPPSRVGRLRPTGGRAGQYSRFGHGITDSQSNPGNVTRLCVDSFHEGIKYRPGQGRACGAGAARARTVAVVALSGAARRHRVVRARE